MSKNKIELHIYDPELQAMRYLYAKDSKGNDIIFYTFDEALNFGKKWEKGIANHIGFTIKIYGY